MKALRTRTFPSWAVCLLSVALMPLLGMPSSTAGTIGPIVEVNAQAFNPSNGELMGEANFPIAVNPDDTFSLEDATFTDPLNRWELQDLDVSGDIDPFTSLGFQVQNNMGFTVNFLMSVSIPIIPIPGATVHGGSTGITVTDANASGAATVATLAGKPYYSGQIDGSTVLSLFSDPYSLTAGPPAGDTKVDATSLGLPATLPSGPALATIGIIAEFSLTAGDRMSSTNFFRVEPIPEPTTLALSGLALFGTCICRRRRHTR